MTVLVLANCSGEEKLATSSETPITLVDGVTSDTPLYLKLSLHWEGLSDTDPYTFHQACYLEKYGSYFTTCTLSVPEAKLFYSHVQFTVGTTDAISCPIVHFQPYFYQRSEVAGFIQNTHNAATYDCSKTVGTPKECFGGAAPQLVTTFPNDTGLYFMSAVALSSDFKLGSSNSIRTYDGRSNLMMTNDLSDGDSAAGTGKYKTVAAGNGARIGGTNGSNWVDYYVYCENLWGETTHQIKIILKDENVENGIDIDDYPDWDHPVNN
ncbi:hypothetical protein DOE51_02625 [Bdellovibrio sp. NC01]|nr:hypothetical protein DOE51_02625 [Bdellovibrio sp. NC01]